MLFDKRVELCRGNEKSCHHFTQAAIIYYTHVCGYFEAALACQEQITKCSEPRISSCRGVLHVLNYGQLLQFCQPRHACTFLLPVVVLWRVTK